MHQIKHGWYSVMCTVAQKYMVLHIIMLMNGIPYAKHRGSLATSVPCMCTPMYSLQRHDAPVALHNCNATMCM